MAVCSQVFQNKRARDEYSNGGMASPDAKRTDSGTLGYDSDLITSMEKIDNIDNNEERDAVTEVEVEMMLNGVIKSLEDEIGMKVQTDNGFESTHQKGSSDQMGLNKQGELIAEVNSEATALVTSDPGNFTYHDDVFADLDFFVDHITADEFGIMMQNYHDRDSWPDIVYSDIAHGYIESTEASYGSMWEDDIWRLNEHPVIQDDFASPQQEEFGISGSMFNNIGNYQLVTDNEKGL